MNRRLLLLFVVVLLNPSRAAADDVGITQVRLIEESPNGYAIEADIAPAILDRIRTPILPDRCSFIGEPERVRVGPNLVVRYRFASGDAPLGPEDELFLPWQRSGIVVTAYWLDGTSQRAFFDRELAGIRLPVQQLVEVEVTTRYLLVGGIADARTNGATMHRS